MKLDDFTGKTLCVDYRIRRQVFKRQKLSATVETLHTSEGRRTETQWHF